MAAKAPWPNGIIQYGVGQEHADKTDGDKHYYGQGLQQRLEHCGTYHEYYQDDHHNEH